MPDSIVILLLVDEPAPLPKTLSEEAFLRFVQSGAAILKLRNEGTYPTLQEWDDWYRAVDEVSAEVAKIGGAYEDEFRVLLSAFEAEIYA